jgi:hypothetical protein
VLRNWYDSLGSLLGKQVTEQARLDQLKAREHGRGEAPQGAEPDQEKLVEMEAGREQIIGEESKNEELTLDERRKSALELLWEKSQKEKEALGRRLTIAETEVSRLLQEIADQKIKEEALRKLFFQEEKLFKQGEPNVKEDEPEVKKTVKAPVETQVA